MTSDIRKLEKSNCKSCEFQFETILPFCPNCGGRVIRKRLTIKSVFQEFYQNIFNIDNKFIITLIDLTIRPQKVFTAYISGARKKYYNPVSLVAIAIVLGTLMSSLMYEELEKEDNSDLQENAYSIGFKSAGGSEEELQEQMKDPEFQKKMEKSKQESLETQKKVNTFVKNNLGLIAYLNIPIYALIAFLVFINKKLYNFAEMVSIVLYQNAYTTLIGFLLSLLFYILGFNVFILSAVSFLTVFIYSNYSFQRLFNFSAKQLIIVNLKFFLVSFVVVLLISILGVALFVLALYLSK
jgi:predicted RNA-binding Zn-ribbon protein involved in translation (DUF1610 family)